MQHKWWHGKTAYQIYPKSFCDTNGDGIGDLRGVISKLDYLRELGVELVWLSPVYRSPLADQGYDISDYYSIDARFGTMADMDELIEKARERGISIVMDLVVNHCSDEHEWFRKACEDPEGEYGQFFYIRDWHEGEPFPCNWRSYFGGPCWDLLPGHTDKIYFHAFHKKQPDLNWENPALRREIYKMINWWLDKGLGGFRIDAIINIKKLLPFCDLPADRDDGLCDIRAMLKRAEGLNVFLDEMAEASFRKYDAFSVGEVFNEKTEDLPKIIGDRGCFSSMFDFSEHLLGLDRRGWHRSRLPTAEEYKRAAFAAQARSAGVGFLSNIIENHDEPRGVSHYLPEGERSDAAKKLLGGLNFLLRGLPFLYQGQEIGMENRTDWTLKDFDDISTLDQYKVALRAGCTEEEALAAVSRFSRDNARTPFQWDAGPGAGFTAGAPWLGLNENYREINLAEQRGREGSVYEFYRSLITLRKSADYGETLVYGECVPYLPEQKNLMAYFRRGEKTLLVAGNFQAEAQDMLLPSPARTLVLNNLDELSAERDTVHLKPWQLVVFEL
ncbi:MAG: alpha-glucosidase [Oscillospiraceae bacterium]|nr:alpha-glucosidase [Oscillospiraceae bacterium]